MINDWSASVPACNEHRFDAKKRLILRMPQLHRHFFALCAYCKRGRLRSSRFFRVK